MLLCYCFLPVYRKLNIYTLSDYLSRRYDDKSRVAYSVIMVLIITMVMMLPAFYIGSRSVNFLLVDQAHINEVLKASAGGVAQTIEIDKTYYILGVLIMALVTGVYTIVGGLKAVIVTDVLQSVLMLAGALIVAWFTFNSVEIGGWDGMRALDAKGKDLVHLVFAFGSSAAAVERDAQRADGAAFLLLGRKPIHRAAGVGSEDR